MNQLNLWGTLPFATEHFNLRRIKLEDANMMFDNWASSSKVTKYLSWPFHESVHITEKVISSWVEKYADTTFYLWGIEEKATGQLIGTVSLFHIQESIGMGEIGYCISETYWGKGIMTEVLNGVMKHAFHILGFAILEACHQKENIASGRVMIKNGMVYIGQSVKQADHLEPILLYHYSITKHAYVMRDLWTRLTTFFHLTEFPMFDSTEQLFEMLLDTGEVIVKKIVMWHHNLQNNQIMPELFYYTTEDDDQTTWYIVAKRLHERLLYQWLTAFEAENAPWLVALDDMSIEKRLVNILHQKGLHISFAESCTGGLLASKLIGISGASYVLDHSYITYSEKAKIELLGVKQKTITQYSVYSAEVAEQMALGLAKKTGADVCVSVTGMAGGDVPTPQDGRYYFAIVLQNNAGSYIHMEKSQVTGSRNEVRNKQASYILYRIFTLLQGRKKG